MSESEAMVWALGLLLAYRVWQDYLAAREKQALAQGLSDILNRAASGGGAPASYLPI